MTHVVRQCWHHWVFLQKTEAAGAVGHMAVLGCPAGPLLPFHDIFIDTHSQANVDQPILTICLSCQLITAMQQRQEVVAGGQQPWEALNSHGVVCAHF